MGRKSKRHTGPYLVHLELHRDRIPNPACYPFNLPAFRELTRLPFHPKVTFLVGENGSGKSTLLEAIAVESGLNPEGGSRHFNFATRATHSALCDIVRLSKTASTPSDSFFLRAESFYNVATEIERLRIDLLPYGDISPHEQSHGESFFALFEHRFHGHGLYLLDEPEAALSPTRQMQFLRILHNYVLQGGQFVIATHSPIIMAYPDACIYCLSGSGIRPMAYTDTEHYLITRGFLLNPQRSLSILLEDDETP